MNPEQLLAHFDRISEAPDAIPRLRRFILDLAVRGKLVEQDPNDEPASQLLKRIQVDKGRLIKQDKLRIDTAGARVDADEGPVEIPTSWHCVKGTLLFIWKDGAPFPKLRGPRAGVERAGAGKPSHYET